MDSNNKKILILYAAVGEGHKVIAENIGFYLQRADYEVNSFDVQKIQSGRLVNVSTGLYQFLIRRLPFVWSWLYNTKWFITLTLPFRKSIGARNHQETLKVIKDLKPDVVISTHVTASGIMEYLKSGNLYAGKFGIVFSDFHLHRYWLYSRADFYLANTEDQKLEMVGLGILPEKIFVCGITLKPKSEVNIASIKNKFGIGSGEKVALIASGSQGTGIDQSLVQQFLGKSNVKVIVVCGKNKKLFEGLSAKFLGSNIVVLGYFSPMEELYCIADVYITKPGGLSMAEALNWHLPVLISHMLPGQEQHNYNYLVKKNLVMPKTANIVNQAVEELSTGNFKKTLVANPWMQLILGNGSGMVEALNSMFK